MNEETEETGKKGWYRWIVFLLVSLVVFATYYVYDAFGPLAETLKQNLHMTNSQFGLIYTSYTFGNVFLFMLFFSGIILDRLGVKKAGILFVSLNLIGTAITSVGAMPQLQSYIGSGLYNFLNIGFYPKLSANLKVMLFGRMIYGVGAEAILLVNNKVLARWFKGKELGFAYGLNLTIARLGTFSAFNLSPHLMQWTNWKVAIWATSGVMLIGFLLFFVYLALEAGSKRAESVDNTEEPFKFADIKALRAPFWFITMLCVTFYSAVFPFTAFSTNMLQHKFHMTATQGGFWTSIVIFATMIFTPIFGYTVDRIGKRASMMIWGALLLVPVHLMLGFTNIPPGIPMFLLGISLSLVPAAMWASIPLMVPDKVLGTAFGIIGYIQNIGLMIFPWLAGMVIDAYTKKIGTATVIDYRWVMLMFASLGLVGFVFALLLKRANSRDPDFDIEKASINR